ncbi:hypothetical protein TUBRATIS_18690 [Tubulinosema ratisbonensis]|uniref:Uncharacterized protein n=1 Tax=Tubulinosema ratisbonensis TaxID=291195 RepID=A0A437AKL3_9MICR|nr:hypothetical protein TUBRATIS_18690 [Tubulinosema ratisbonensis]
MTKNTLKELILQKIKEYHNSKEVVDFYSQFLENFVLTFNFEEFFAKNKLKATRVLKTDKELLNLCINLFYQAMILNNEISHDKIKDNSYSVIGALTLTSVLFLVMNEEESFIFNEVLYKINIPQEKERTYEEDNEFVKFCSFVVLPHLLIGIDLTKEDE